MGHRDPHGIARAPWPALAALVLGALVTPARAQSPDATADGIREQLERLDPDVPDMTAARVIARRGEPALEGVLAFLESAGPNDLAAGPRETLEECMRLVNRPLTRDFLRGIVRGEESNPARDLAALWMYGAMEDAPSLVAMTSLANRSPESLGTLYAQAVARTLTQHPDAHSSAAEMGRVAGTALLPYLAEAIGRAGHRSGISALTSLLHHDEGVDTIVLREMASIAARHPAPFSPHVSTEARRFLDSEGPSLRWAVEALGRLEDVECAPRLVALLDSEDPDVATRALAALRGVSRQQFPSRAVMWDVWMREEERWWNDDAPALLEQLHVGEMPEIVQRLRVLAGHTLHRHEIAPEVAVLLGHEDETVRRLACVTLGQLGSASVLRELRDARNDPTIAQEALHALQLLAPDERPQPD